MDASTKIADKILLSTSTVVLIITIALVVIGALAIFLVHQNQQISKLKEAAKPRYGFLGKPVLPVMVVALLIGSLGLTYYAQKNGENVSVNEEAKVELSVKTVVLEVTDTEATVRFSVVPQVDTIDWGIKPGDTVEAYWTITGPKTFSEFEIGLNINKKGGFTKTLPRGNYTVTVNVMALGKNWTKTVEMIL